MQHSCCGAAKIVIKYIDVVGALNGPDRPDWCISCFDMSLVKNGYVTWVPIEFCPFCGQRLPRADEFNLEEVIDHLKLKKSTLKGINRSALKDIDKTLDVLEDLLYEGI